MNQQGDVKLFQTLDDGDIEVEGGIVAMDGGLEGAVFISLFGGNQDGSAYWGNRLELAKARQLVSETQTLLHTIPATPFNLRRIEEAAKRDLNWVIDERAASSVEVSASIPSLNRIRLHVKVSAQGGESTFIFAENWKTDA